MADSFWGNAWDSAVLGVMGIGNYVGVVSDDALATEALQQYAEQTGTEYQPWIKDEIVNSGTVGAHVYAAGQATNQFSNAPSLPAGLQVAPSIPWWVWVGGGYLLWRHYK